MTFRIPHKNAVFTGKFAFFGFSDNYKIAHFITFLYVKMGYKMGYRYFEMGYKKIVDFEIPLNDKITNFISVF